MSRWPTLRVDKNVMVTDEIGLVAEEASSGWKFLCIILQMVVYVGGGVLIASLEQHS
jgi:hypothetical protein